MENYLEWLIGKDRYEKEEKLRISLLEIERKYHDFFSSRPPKYNIDSHDRLHNHYMIIGDNDKLIFGFPKDTEVPIHIIKECLNCFDQIFNK